MEKCDKRFEKSETVDIFQSKHLNLEVTLHSTSHFLNLKETKQQTKCFVSDQRKCFSLNRMQALGGILFLPPLFSPSNLFIVSCQALLIYLCIKWSNYSYSLFIKPEKRVIVSSCVSSVPGNVFSSSAGHRASYSGWAANTVAALKSWFLILYSFSFQTKGVLRYSLNQLQNAVSLEAARVFLKRRCPAVYFYGSNESLAVEYCLKEEKKKGDNDQFNTTKSFPQFATSIMFKCLSAFSWYIPF